MDAIRYRCPTPLGPVAFTLRGEALVAIDLPGEAGGDDGRPARTGLAADVARQLRAWFDDPRHRFDLPLAPAGTAFRQRVWAALRAIPPGEVRTYGELAAALDTSARAVGGACRANPLPLVVPCHRVVAAGGLGGFAGADAEGPELALKRRLLAREGVRFPA